MSESKAPYETRADKPKLIKISLVPWGEGLAIQTDWSNDRHQAQVVPFPCGAAEVVEALKILGRRIYGDIQIR